MNNVRIASRRGRAWSGGARALVAAASLLLVPAVALAESLPMGPRGIGMGEADIGGAYSNDAVTTNPAGIALWRRYIFEGGYGRYVGRDGNAFLASIIDTYTSALGAGLTYVYTDLDRALLDDQPRSQHRVEFALAYPATDFIFVGVDIKYLKSNVDKFPGRSGYIYGPAAAPDHLGRDTNAVTVDLGAMLRPTEVFQLGLVGRNLIPTASDELPIMAGTGVQLAPMSWLRANGDVLFDFQSGDAISYHYRGGLELTLISVPLRGGFGYDDRRDPGALDTYFYTLGLGWMGPKIAFDLAYKQRLDEGADDRLAMGSVRLSFM